MEQQTVRRWRRWFPATVVVAIIAVGGLINVFSDPDDGVEYDKVYGLAKSFPVEMEMPNGAAIPGRQFDFADRNVPVTSIVVPDKDPRGVPVVVWDNSLTLMKTKAGKPMGVVRKVLVKVMAREIEGEPYPAYEYPQWRYRLAYVDEAIHTPRVIPKR